MSIHIRIAPFVKLRLAFRGAYLHIGPVVLHRPWRKAKS